MKKESSGYQELLERISFLEKRIEELTQSEFLYKSIYDRMPYGIQIFDRYGFSYKINDAQKIILGLPNPEEGIGKFNVLTDPFSTSNGLSDIYKNVYQGREFVHEFEYDFSVDENSWNTKKEKIILQEKIFPLFDDKERVNFVIALLNDVTINRNSEKEIVSAKERAEESEKQFRLIVDNAPEPIFIQVDYKFAYLNSAALTLYGAKDIDELINTQVIDRIHPNSREIVKTRIFNLNNRHIPMSDIENFHLKMDNSNIAVEISAVPVTYNGQNGALVFLKDIGERKRLEAEKNRGYELLNILAKQVPGVIYQYRLYPDGHSAFPYSSPGMFEIYEVTSEEVREDASPVFTRIHPNDYDYIVETISESANNQTEYTSEFRVILPKQGLRWRHCDAKPELLEDGSTLWYGIITDITERRRIQDELVLINENLKQTIIELEIAKDGAEKNEAKFRSLFNSMQEGVYLHEIIYDENNKPLNYKILEVNKISEKYLNIGCEYAIGKLATELYGLTEAPFLEVYANVAETGIPVSFEQYFEPMDKYFQISAFSSQKGTFATVFSDITLSKKYEKELIMAKERAEQSDKLKSAFLQNMSHEIRTPLNAICGFTDLLEDPRLSSDEKYKYLEIVKNSGQQLLSIISDIITISSIETKQETLHIKQFDLNQLIKELFSIFKPHTDKKSINFISKCALPDYQASIVTDKTKVTQILTNLLSNAIKFTNSGFVEFGYELIEFQNNPEIKFFVRDSGIGIKNELCEIIFERFRQADLSISKDYGGTGLGLSISRGFAEMLGGKIWVETEEGKGSTFYITIPYKQKNINE